MGRFFKLVAIACGLYFGWQRFNAPKAPVWDESQGAAIEIYTTPTCGYCKQAKAYMDRQGIEYHEKDVENDMDFKREYRERGGSGVPSLFVYGKPLSGWNRQRFEELREAGS